MTRTLALLALPVLLVLLVAMPLALSCAKSSPDGGCKAEDMAGLRKALPTIDDAESRANIISTALGEACTDLPSGVAKALQDVPKAYAADRAMLAAAAIADNMRFTKLSCPDAEKVFGAMANADGPQRGSMVYRGCGFAKLDLVTETEMQKAMDTVGVSAMLATSMFVWLGDHGMAKAEAKSLARGMMALP